MIEAKSLTLPANAKINLFLDIIRKRKDGYHDIITEMQEIDLADTITVELMGEGINITCNNPGVPIDNRNIAYRAAELFICEMETDCANRQTCGRRVFGGINITIQKRIPLMAGLGGSSTDGAAVLKALNLLHGGVFSDNALLEMGAKLSADLPFFIIGGRAECRGIGDIITPLPDLATQFYVIIQPSFYCDTQKAYELYSSFSRKYNGGNIFQQLYNDERIENACSELINAGASLASMTGSGSAVFGVFPNEQSASTALSKLDYPFKCIAHNKDRGNKP